MVGTGLTFLAIGTEFTSNIIGRIIPIPHWASLLIGAVAFTFVSFRVWLKEYERAERSQQAMTTLSDALYNVRRQRLEQALNDAQFLWDNKVEESSRFWNDSRYQWFRRAVIALADCREIDLKTAERELRDTAPMESGAKGSDHLRRQIEKLKTTLSSFDS